MRHGPARRGRRARHGSAQVPRSGKRRHRRGPKGPAAHAEDPVGSGCIGWFGICLSQVFKEFVSQIVMQTMQRFGLSSGFKFLEAT